MMNRMKQKVALVAVLCLLLFSGTAVAADAEAKWGTSESDLTGGSGTFAEAIAASPAYIQLQSDVSASYLTIKGMTTLDLNNCTITGNGSQRIFWVDGGKLTLTDTSAEKGGKITNAGGDDAAVVIGSGGEFIMEAGSITGNTMGGVRVYKATFTMNGGSITNNSGYKGGGISSESDDWDGAATFKLSGTVDISGNTATDMGDDIYLSCQSNYDSNVTIGKNLSLSSPIHVSKSVTAEKNTFATAADGVTLDDTHKGYFISDHPDYPVVSLDSTNNALCLISCDHANVSDNTCSACGSKMIATLESGGTTTYHHALHTALNAAASTTSENVGTITLLDNVDGAGNITMTGGAVMLDLNNKTISNTRFWIKNGSILTLKNGTISDEYYGVYVEDGSVTLDNIKIESNHENGYGDIYIAGDDPIIIQSIPDGEVYTVNAGSGYDGKLFAKPADGVGALNKENWTSLQPGGLITENDDGSLAFAACDHSGSEHIAYKDTWIDQHSFICTVCNKTGYEKHYGEGLEYSDNGNGSHRYICVFCFYDVTEAHTPTYTATNNTITESCSKCKVTLGTATLTATNATYDGTAKDGAMVECSDGWTGDRNLTVTYADNVNAGTATASITFGGVTARATFTIQPKDITGATVATQGSSFVYSGEPLTPEVSVTLDSKTLAATDYQVSYDDNVNAGQATVTVTGKGNYSGSATTTFTIAKAPAPTLPAIKVSRNYAATKVSVPTGIVAGEGSTVSVGAASGSGAGKVSNPALDDKGNLTFTLSGGANGETIELPVSIQSPNYEGTITATVTVTLTDKLDQRPLTVKATGTTVPSGGRLELSTSGGSGKGAVTYEVIKGTGSASVSGSTLTGEASGTVTVIATKEGTGQYNPARSQPLVITIE